MEKKELKGNKIVFVDLSFNLVDSEGVELTELSVEVRKKKEQRPIQQKDLVTIPAGRMLGKLLAESSEDFGGREFEWYPELLKSNSVNLGKTDIDDILGFIDRSRKAKEISNNVYKQIKDKLDSAKEEIPSK